jgi:hypothetical protein
MQSAQELALARQLRSRGLSEAQIQAAIKEKINHAGELSENFAWTAEGKALATATSYTHSAPARLIGSTGKLGTSRSLKRNRSAVKGTAAAARSSAMAASTTAAVAAATSGIASSASTAAAAMRQTGLGLASTFAEVVDASDSTVAVAAADAMDAALGVGVVAGKKANEMISAVNEKGMEMTLSDKAAKAALGSALGELGAAATSAIREGMAAASATAAEGLSAAQAAAEKIGQYAGDIAALGDLARNAFRQAAEAKDLLLGDILKMFAKPLYLPPGETVYRIRVCKTCGGGSTGPEGCAILLPGNYVEIAFPESFRAEIESVPGLKVLAHPREAGVFMIQNESDLYPGQQLLQGIGILYQAFRDKQVKAGLIAD